MSEELKDKIIELNSQLATARHAYYVDSAPIVADSVYDALERELKTLVDENPDYAKYAYTLTTVGSDLRDDANRVKHKTLMLSLENKYTVDEIVAWMDDLPAGTVVAIEPKVDGLSLSLRYVNKKLVLATTRGDGEYGEDVTAQVFASPSIPKTLSDNFPETPVEIRGEAFIIKTVFDKLNTEAEAIGDKVYANPRNLASGTLKLKNLKEVTKRDLRFHPWEVHGIPANKLGASKDLEFLHNNSKFGEPGWRKPILTRITDSKQLAKAIHELGKEREYWHSGLGMLTDGIVFKVEDKELRKKLGTGTKFPKHSCCFKFQSLQGVTKLLDVEWSSGRSGVLTPVGILEPINLGGSMISRVNLNNLSFIENLGLSIGCDVQIVKSGDVIPTVTSLEKPGTKNIGVPSACPECGHSVEVFEDPKSKVKSCYCSDFNCPSKVKAHLVYIGQRTVLDIEGLGPQLVELLVNNGVVSDISDVFVLAQNLTAFGDKYGEEKLEAQIKKEGFPVAQTLELLRGLESSKEKPWDRWLAALGIPGIGLVLAKNIASHLELDGESMPILHEILPQLGESGFEMEGLGTKKYDSIVEWCKLPNVPQMLQNLYDMGVRPKALGRPKKLEGPTPLAGEKICITGEFPSYGEREYLQDALKSLGAEIKGVSKKLTILVAGDGAGPSKLSKAKDLGIRIEGESWLRAVFTDYKLEKKPKFDVEEESMEDL